MDFNIVVLDSWSDCGTVLLADLRMTYKVLISIKLCRKFDCIVPFRV